MKFEHFGINVPDPVAMADWYVENCGMKVVRSGEPPINMRFLADDTGRVVVELYCNPKADVPDYPNQHPLIYHFAVVANDPEAQRDRLLAAGATLFVEEPFDDGSLLIMLRDPWGIPLQLCKRAVPMA